MYHICSREETLGDREHLSAKAIMKDLLVGVTTFGKGHLHVTSLEWRTSLLIGFEGRWGTVVLEIREKEDEGADADAGAHHLPLLNSPEHFERALGFRIHLVHVLSQLEIEQGDLVVGKVRSELDRNGLAAVQARPLRMVILLIGVLAHSLHECLALLETVEFESFSERIEVS